MAEPAGGPERRCPGVSVAALEMGSPPHAQLERAGLLGLAPAEVWTVNGSNRGNAYATHGVFRYFGKYPPPIGDRLIRGHTEPGDLVVDPMCGSGTTGVEALLLGRRSRLSDVNPLSALVARAKTTRVSLADSQPACARVLAAARPRTEADTGFVPVGLRDPDHWFLPETMDSLRGLRAALEGLDDGPVADLLWTAFAATVRRVSRATTQQGRLFLDARTARADALPTFRRAATRALAAAAELPQGPAPEVTLADARAPAAAAAEPARLTILHPPYFNAYRYSRVNCLELAWLGHPVKPLRATEVREHFKVGDPNKVVEYVDDMVCVLQGAAAATAPGGVVALMIGDTVLRGAHVPATRMILDRLDERLALEQIAVRRPRHTEATWVASQRRRRGALGAALSDYVLRLRRA
ncbi:MAG: hypothetical protein CSA66_00575 [Proteobacteria bacterium]|nr:MAG: hypothetical protein CSA66_00575 [Pseudomonadota bacterium]